MASKRRRNTGRMTSSAVVRPGKTILDVATEIMKASDNAGLSPQEIAEVATLAKQMTLPRGRTSGYLSQLIQSMLYNNILYAAKPVVKRVGYARYKLTAAGLRK